MPLLQNDPEILLGLNSFRQNLATNTSSFAAHFEMASFALSIIVSHEEYAFVDKQAVLNVINELNISLSSNKLPGRALFLLYAIIRKKFLVAKNGISESEIEIVKYFLRPPASPETQELHIREWGDVISANSIKNYVDDNIKTTKDHADSTSQAVLSFDKKILAWREELEKHESLVTKLIQKYNFAGLSHAFSSMEKIVSREKAILTTGLFTLAILALTPILVAAYVGFTRITQLNADTFDQTMHEAYVSIISIGPLLLSSEILLVYFFRVLLKQHQSAKAQILQLRLRNSVCAFIEGYARFSSQNEHTKLEKFEALIFSGLSADPEKIPSTFDGLGPLAELIKSARA